MYRTLVAMWAVTIFCTSVCQGQADTTKGSNDFTIPVPAVKSADESDEHPLHEVIDFAKQRLQFIRANVKDYTCYLVKRERIDGHLLPSEHMFVKFRAPQETSDASVPFSIYLRFLAPGRMKEREVLYVEGENEDEMVVRKGGRRSPFLTMLIDPNGRMAMRENKYPIHAFGFDNLISRLIEVAQNETQYGEFHLQLIEGAKVDGRSCKVYEFTHPVRRSHFRYHLARIFIDEKLGIPIRYASYDWPESPDQEPPLLEEYTYRDVKLNVGLTDETFDRKNPEYKFGPLQDRDNLGVNGAGAVSDDANPGDANPGDANP